jgi:hypothetical protein
LVARPRLLPHGWDAGVLFEEKSGVLLCSDLLLTASEGGNERLIGRYTLIHEGTHHRRYTGSSQPLR